MREQCPVRAGNLALTNCLIPQCTEGVRIGGTGKALDRRVVALVERLVQRLGNLSILAREPHCLVVQHRIAHAIHFDVARHQLA